MRISPIIIILAVSLFSSTILIRPFAVCDPSNEPFLLMERKVDIEGAHIVSEGAYFRFWIFNNNTYWPMNVTINGETLHVPPMNGTNYDVIAPNNISAPYERINYTFVIVQSWNEIPVLTVNFTVLVLSSKYLQISSFIQIPSLLVPMLIVFAAIIVALVATAIIRRRRVHRKT